MEQGLLLPCLQEVLVLLCLGLQQAHFVIPLIAVSVIFHQPISKLNFYDHWSKSSSKHFKITPLSSVDMEKVSGGAYCLKGKGLGAATGLCIVGGLLNPYVGVGCAVWGTYHYFACWFKWGSCLTIRHEPRELMYWELKLQRWSKSEILRNLIQRAFQ